MFYFLIISLAIEFSFRLFIETREIKIFSRYNPLAWARLIPIVNDFVPIPETREPISESPFVRFHEEAHSKNKHNLKRLFIKTLFALSMLYCFIYFKMNLWNFVIFFHSMLFYLQIPYHWYLWQQEISADTYAQKKTSKNKAKKELENLLKQEIPYSSLFALFYREHPPARLRLSATQKIK